MNSEEKSEYSSMVDKCRACSDDEIEEKIREFAGDPRGMFCLQCHRYFRQKRMFLNNVG